MRNLSSVGLLVALSSAPLLAIAAQPAALTITVECPHNPKCIFWGEDMPIRMIMRNSSQSQIGVPLEYMRKVGPYIRLIDVKSKNAIDLHVNLASHDLMAVFTPVQPGAAVEMAGNIAASEIETFGKKLINLDGEAGVSATLRFDNDEIIDFASSGKFRIIGRDTLDRESPSIQHLKRAKSD